MLPRAALCLLFLALAPAALAEPIDLLPGPAERLQEQPREQLFISPSGEPFRAGPGEAYPVTTWFARADADHDGRLDLAEFMADHLAFFRRLDVSGDGVIDAFESAAYERDIAPEIVERRPASRGAKPAGRTLFSKRAPIRSSGGQGAARYGLINEPLPVRAADANFDYKVSLQEADAAARRRFALLDKDGDGAIALAELPRTNVQIERDDDPRT